MKKQTHIHTGYFSFAQAGNGFTGTGEQSGSCHGHMTGTVRCAYADNGISFVWQGDWLANRER